MQIGHQLADVHIAQWVRLLAEKAVATDWNSEKTRDTMQSALLDMPPHVQVLPLSLFALDSHTYSDKNAVMARNSVFFCWNRWVFWVHFSGLLVPCQSFAWFNI